MNDTDFLDIFENCIQQMQNGIDLETVLSHLPDHEEDLHSGLEAAVFALDLEKNLESLDPAAQMKSRSTFLGGSFTKRTPSIMRGIFPALSFQFGTLLAIFIGVLMISLLGVGLVSAQSLPGDLFYPVKIAVEKVNVNLATNPDSHLYREEQFDHRRVEEVMRLVERGRKDKVSFAGFLQMSQNDRWFVAGIPVIFNEEQMANVFVLRSTYTEVEGMTTSLGVEVDSIKLRLFHLEGRVQEISPRQWLVDGVRVKIDPATSISETPEIGQRVALTAVRVESGGLLALAIRKVSMEVNQQEDLLQESNPAETPSLHSPAGSWSDEENGEFNYGDLEKFDLEWKGTAGNEQMEGESAGEVDSIGDDQSLDETGKDSSEDDSEQKDEDREDGSEDEKDKSDEKED